MYLLSLCFRPSTIHFQDPTKSVGDGDLIEPKRASDGDDSYWEESDESDALEDAIDQALENYRLSNSFRDPVATNLGNFSL